MNSTNKRQFEFGREYVWEICKFWILQTLQVYFLPKRKFERYVNFEFYKPRYKTLSNSLVWEICKFWILQTCGVNKRLTHGVWEICKFWILQTPIDNIEILSQVWEICKFWILQTFERTENKEQLFERYVNFEFYKLNRESNKTTLSLRDM